MRYAIGRRRIRPMSKVSDFTDAHLRHRQDAELLFAHDRWANADQLYGLSAECGLKAVMQELGMPVDATGRPEAKYRKHVNELWPIFHDFAKGRDGAHYLAMLPDGSPFANWTIEDRYANRSDFHGADVELHRAASREIVRMVSEAGLG